MKKILLNYLLLFGTYTFISAQGVQPKSNNINNFNSRFMEWDNDRFEAMYNGQWKPHPADSLKINGKKHSGDTSRYYYDAFMNHFIDESRRVGSIKFGRNIFQFLSDEKYDFHACSLLYNLFPPYPFAPVGTGFVYTSREKWISSGQQAFDLKYWKDQFFGNENLHISLKSEYNNY